jgi:hypothetical protein
VLVVGALVVGALVVVIDVLGVGALVVLVVVLADAFEGLVVVLLLVLLLLGPRVIGTAVDTAVDVGPSSEEADVVAHAAHTAHPAARSAAARRGVIRRASR